MKVITGMWGGWSFRWGKYPAIEEIKKLVDSENAYVRIFQKDVDIAHMPVKDIPFSDLSLIPPGPYILPQVILLEGMRYEAPAWFRPYFIVEER